jgi:hypothetical protein
VVNGYVSAPAAIGGDIIEIISSPVLAPGGEDFI